jgi:hypothetical protein
MPVPRQGNSLGTGLVNLVPLLLKLFWILHEHYNYLQITQVEDNLQVIKFTSTVGLACGW